MLDTATSDNRRVSPRVFVGDGLIGFDPPTLGLGAAGGGGLFRVFLSSRFTGFDRWQGQVVADGYHLLIGRRSARECGFSGDRAATIVGRLCHLAGK